MALGWLRGRPASPADDDENVHNETSGAVGLSIAIVDASVAEQAGEGRTAKDASAMHVVGTARSDATPSIAREVGRPALVVTPEAIVTRVGPTVA